MNTSSLPSVARALDPSCPLDSTLVDLFDAQVAATPERTALVFVGDNGHERRWSYAQLDAQANRIAWALDRRHRDIYGAPPAADRLIGLYMDRCPEAVVAILGILKAGAAYVPLSPEHPPERTRYIVQDTELNLVLARSCVRDSLDDALGPVDGAAEVIAIDDWSALRDAPSDAPAVTLDAGNLAYVFYTSGSTGKPKGVLIEHRSTVNTLWALRAVYDFQQPRRSGCFSSFVFDVSVSEMFNALCFGGELHLFDSAIRTDMDRLSEYIRTQALDYVFLPPAVLSILPDPGYPSVKAFVFAGEPCEQTSCARWSQNYALYNYYGPTEATIYATGKQAVLPNLNEIGRPLGNMSVYVLDESGQPTPDGQPGELYLAGPGVARGYLDQPAMTAERFVCNPFAQAGDVATSRMYRTGDVVRWRLDEAGAPAHLEFIGRNDSQVKIRGLRVELGEIEAALLRLPDVCQAIVLAHGAGSDTFLAAYIVGTESGAAAVDALRDALAESLPDYMIPLSFNLIERVPLTVNGKTDYKALPPPTLASQSDYVAPESATERALSTLWAEVLDRTQVGVDDNYFHIGGNSLSATRLIMLAQRQLGLELTVSELMSYPTVRALAARLDARAAATRVAPITANGTAQELILSPAQERLLFANHYGELGRAYHIHEWLILDEGVGVDVFAQALRQVVARHDILRSRFWIDRQGRCLGAVKDAENILNENVIALPDEPSAATEALRAPLETPFNLGTEAPMRARLFNVHGQLHVLLVWHHIAMDGGSLELFLDELSAAIAARLDAQAPALPELPIQYHDYARWLIEHANDEHDDELAAFWQQTMAGYDTLPLPLDKQRSSVVSAAGRDRYFTLDKRICDQLRALAKQRQCSVYSVLLTAMNLAMARFCNATDIVIGTPVDNRERVETRDLIGMFANLVPMRCALDPSATLNDTVDQIHTGVLAALAHRDFPFEHMVKLLEVSRAAGRHPLFQVTFSVRDGACGERLGLRRAVVPGEEALNRTSKLDLSVMVDVTQPEWVVEVNGAAAVFEAASLERVFELFDQSVSDLLERGQHRLDALDLPAAQAASAARAMAAVRDLDFSLAAATAAESAAHMVCLPVDARLGPPTAAGVAQRAQLVAGVQVALALFSTREDCVVGVCSQPGADGQHMRLSHQRVTLDTPVDELVRGVGRDLDATSGAPVVSLVDWPVHTRRRLVRVTQSVVATPALLDLRVEVDADGQVSGVLVYDKTQITAEGAQQFLSTLKCVWTSLAAANAPTVGALNWLDDAERTRLLADGTGPRSSGEAERSLVEQFRDVVAQHSARPAVRHSDDDGRQATVTYRELDKRSEQIAADLVAALPSTSHERLVGIYLERSIDFVASVLGVLKAGCAWLPVLPTGPSLRNARVCREARPDCFVTRGVDRPALDELLQRAACGAPVVVCDGADVASRALPSDCAAPVRSQDLAYVLYTSGSTGQPKGVAVGQRALNNYLQHQSQTLGIDENEVLIWLAQPVFDASIEQLFLAVLNGALLTIPAASEARDPVQLRERIVQWGVTHMHATPTMLGALSDGIADAASEFGTLKRVLAGGERSPAAVRSTWGSLLYNKYGPTETTISSVTCAEPQTQLAPDVIGRPVRDTALYVLSGNGRLLPPGAPGELYVAGAGLAAGYRGRSALTAARFVPNPYADDALVAAGQRMYRTGDRVRWAYDRAAGAPRIVFLDRIDRQIKLRGFRIELGEIEACLASHRDVRQVVADVVEFGPQDRGLAVWCVPDSPAAEPFDVEALRAFAAQHLPDYMQPAAYSTLAALPLLPSGKVDRAQLPAARREDISVYVPPANDTERQLAQIWADLLSIAKPIGRDADFFELGGHSLLTTKMVAQIDAAFEVRPALADVFANGTLRAVARGIDARIAAGETSGDQRVTVFHDDHAFDMDEFEL